MEVFLGSNADLEDAAEQFYSSPLCPQPLRFETLSLKTPKLSHPFQVQLCKIELKINQTKIWVLKHPTTATNWGVPGFYYGSGRNTVS